MIEESVGAIPEVRSGWVSTRSGLVGVAVIARLVKSSVSASVDVEIMSAAESGIAVSASGREAVVVWIADVGTSPVIAVGTVNESPSEVSVELPRSVPVAYGRSGVNVTGSEDSSASELGDPIVVLGE